MLSRSVVLLLLIYPHNTYASDNCWTVPAYLVRFRHLYCVIVAIMVIPHSWSALAILADARRIQAARYQAITKCIASMSSPSLPCPCNNYVNLTFGDSMGCAQDSCKFLSHSSCQVSRDHETYCWYEFTIFTASL